MSSELMTIDQVVNQIRDNLARLWEFSTDEEGLMPVEQQNALSTVWNFVQMMQAAVDQNERALAAALTTAKDLEMQRDIAVRESQFTQRKREEAVIQDLARYIGHDAKIAPNDVARVLKMLAGLHELPVSPYTMEDFYEQFRELATEAFAEEIYLADAMAEYDDEIARDQQVAADAADWGE